MGGKGLLTAIIKEMNELLAEMKKNALMNSKIKLKRQKNVQFRSHDKNGEKSPFLNL